MTISAPAKRLLWVTGMFAFMAWLGVHGTGGISSDEEVAFYSPYLFWDDTTLRLVLRGRVYEPEEDSQKRRMAVERLIQPTLFRYIGKNPGEFDRASRERMYLMTHRFLADGESGVALEVRVRGVGGEATVRLRRTGAGGYFSVELGAAGDRPICELAAGGPLSIDAVVPRDDPRRFGAELLVPPTRLSLLVVSDVDDTVRIADVTDPPRMIERVFLHEYEPVPDMAAVYDGLARLGARFHFVSGSPWQVAPEIERMLADGGFPPAVLHCRQIGWDFWNSDPRHTFDFKVARISELLDQFRSCPVLLIGDSGEHDPKVYTEIVRRYPDRVAGVWIRRVGPPWDATRLAEVTTRLGTDRAIAFGEPDELTNALPKIMTPR